jgi:hypothetical protein
VPRRRGLAAGVRRSGSGHPGARIADRALIMTLAVRSCLGLPRTEDADRTLGWKFASPPTATVAIFKKISAKEFRTIKIERQSSTENGTTYSDHVSSLVDRLSYSFTTR